MNELHGRGPIPSNDVIGILQYLFAVRSTLRHIRSRPTLRVGARGPEFVAHRGRDWLEKADVQTLFMAKGCPWENRYAESLNGKLRWSSDLVSGRLPT